MRTVNVHAAKTHLSQLLEEVQRGEEITIAKAGKPVARLVPILPEAPLRKPGILRDHIWIDPTWDPVASDPEIVRLFEESDWLPNEPPEGAEIADEGADRK
jgi:prevent-host-death family protein